MKPRWFKGRVEQQKKELKANFLAADLTRERLVEMLEEDIDRSLRAMRGAAKNQNNNLSEFYAAELAKQEVLDDLINLIKE